MKLFFTKYPAIIFCFLYICIFSSSPAISAGDFNVYIHGRLVAEPCDLVMEDKELTVDFDTIIDRYLYKNVRTHPEDFNIRLINCDLGLDPTVKVGFIGAENPNLPGFLALDGGSTATHIGIGIQDINGRFIPINSLTPPYLLNSESNILRFQGYVEAESDAIKNRNIRLGPFTATAIFLLDYE
ncbi:TPA: fimbrial protein [Proteus mirabilis]|nr:type 1 fimbrial protein [Proteus mirabilis]HEK0447482.1 type 1 fimbrial protein [Proteus mirabilis]HEK2945492.1 type 1 fimbrial protein [Proteus mirabilis]